jgi:hypothetical protein
VSPERFSITKLETVVGSCFDLTAGHLRANFDLPQDDYPEYLELDGTIDDPMTGDDDERLVEIMGMFEHDAHVRGKKSFVMEYVLDA